MQSGKLFRNVSALVVAQGITKAVNFVVSIILIRYLGVQELGRYAYVIAFAYPFGALADFGLAAYSIREISRDLSRASEVMAVLTRTMLVLAGTAGSAMVVVAVLARHDAVTTACMVIVALSNLISVATTPFMVALTAREELHHLSLYRVLASALGAVATLVVLVWGGGVLALFVAAAGVNVVMWYVGRSLAGPIAFRAPVPLSAIRSMVRQALPFGILLLGFALYYRVDIIMLRWLRDESEVGLYSAAYRFLDTIIVLAASLGGPFFPRLSNLVGRDLQGVRDIIESSWKLLLAIGLPVTVITFFVAYPLMQVLFGNEFVNAGAFLQILIWGSLPILLISIPSHALNAADRVWVLAGVFGLSALVNVLANLLLIPRWGATGASLATVACEWLNLVLVACLVQREFHVSFSPAGLWRYLLAVTSMVLVLWLASDYGLVVMMLGALLAYGAGLLLLGYLRSADMLAMRRLFAQ
jgi:O-antigen/teichoic acid export membrane protein